MPGEFAQVGNSDVILSGLVRPSTTHPQAMSRGSRITDRKSRRVKGKTPQISPIVDHQKQIGKFNHPNPLLQNLHISRRIAIWVQPPCFSGTSPFLEGDVSKGAA